MSIVKHAVIAAAGLGSRLGHGKPKCLVKALGKPIIAYLLDLLVDVEDVRIVVGFREDLVMQTIKQFRRDVLFVRNPNFHSTKTLESYAMGANRLKDSVLFMDGDIFFESVSFKNFLNCCHGSQVLVGITDAKTVDAVFVNVDERHQVKSFSRNNKSAYEWANIMYAPANYFEEQSGDVFKRLEKDLPLPAQYINSYEIDCEEDLEKAISFIENTQESSKVRSNSLVFS